MKSALRLTAFIANSRSNNPIKTLLLESEVKAIIWSFLENWRQNTFTRSTSKLTAARYLSRRVCEPADVKQILDNVLLNAPQTIAQRKLSWAVALTLLVHQLKGSIVSAGYNDAGRS